jgi:hypothetical protein
MRAPAVRVSLALIVAPVLALADQSVAFSLVGWACSHQTTAWLHASHGIFFVAAAGAAALAWTTWRDVPTHPDRHGARLQVRFLGGVAVTVAILSAASIAAMWIPTWMISACAA